MWFNQKTLAEKIEIVKNVAKKEQLTGNAYAIYCAIALEDYNWEDAASYFLTEYIKEAVADRI
jgi:hypothetical protein